eukprot:CAMPEP_0115253682 /NCGR_PEP_ID=MMETSP0270-20121206/44799_1 /TAXON_ID=71861 /ORGANISM="Scrippsiella trochoidea, Strain CCMP3099" /LENGTH=49 /DNA_ID=CAMNT_0002669197 /DNA_START=389 /DNA_END=538 /DNA_ORIENTATION=-
MQLLEAAFEIMQESQNHQGVARALNSASMEVVGWLCQDEIPHLPDGVPL